MDNDDYDDVQNLLELPPSPLPDTNDATKSNAQPSGATVDDFKLKNDDGKDKSMVVSGAKGHDASEKGLKRRLSNEFGKNDETDAYMMWLAGQTDNPVMYRPKKLPIAPGSSLKKKVSILSTPGISFGTPSHGRKSGKNLTQAAIASITPMVGKKEAVVKIDHTVCKGSKCESAANNENNNNSKSVNDDKNPCRAVAVKPEDDDDKDMIKKLDF